MTSFSQQLQSAMTRIKLRAEAIAEQVVVDVGQSLVDKTPYGVWHKWSDQAKESRPNPPYKPGQLRGAWHHGIGAPNLSTDFEVDKTGEASMKRIKAGAKANPIGKHYISNSQEYAMLAEEGAMMHARGQQSPAKAMVQLTELEFPQIVKAAVMKVKV